MSKEISRFLSYVLRHAPEAIGLQLDAAGWADVSELVTKCHMAGKSFDLETLRAVVAENDKKRFTLSDDGRRIRAAQGHSIPVDLGLMPIMPPETLFHGTAQAKLEAIRRDGLQPGRRQKVHLSQDKDTAIIVGRRHGNPVVLCVEAGRMHADGLLFWQAHNGVWLTDRVPPRYLNL